MWRLSPRVKRLFRRCERIAQAIVLLLVLALFGQAVLGPRYLAYRFTPSGRIDNPRQLEAAIGASVQTRTLQVEGRAYLLALGPMLMWAWPEGPPAYVFDAAGGLLDFTPDMGDDPAFLERWIIPSDFESSGGSIHDSL